MVAKYTFKSAVKRSYHRNSTMSKAEIMLIMILFHDSNYRCLKHFYQERVCKHLRHLFPKVVSYNRFVELEREVAVPVAKRKVFHGMVLWFQAFMEFIYGKLVGDKGFNECIRQTPTS